MNHMNSVALVFVAIVITGAMIGHLDSPVISQALVEPCKTLNNAILEFIVFVTAVLAVMYYLLRLMKHSRAGIAVYSFVYLVVTLLFAWAIFDDGRTAPSSLYFLTSSCIN